MITLRLGQGFVLGHERSGLVREADLRVKLSTRADVR